MINEKTKAKQAIELTSIKLTKKGKENAKRFYEENALKERQYCSLGGKSYESPIES